MYNLKLMTFVDDLTHFRGMMHTHVQLKGSWTAETARLKPCRFILKTSNLIYFWVKLRVGSSDGSKKKQLQVCEQSAAEQVSLDVALVPFLF